MKTLCIDDHDRGLQDDLEQMAALRARRRMLGYMLSGGAMLFTGCGGGGNSNDSSAATSSASSSSSSDSSGSTTSSCVADPQETNGPYPGDGSNTVNGMAANVLTESGVVRSDIRSSFGSSTTVAPGVPLKLALSLVNTNNSCAALAGYAVYMWHCTRDGQYSMYSSGIQDENFLRGVQVSDASGIVTFTTIFPGCYSGRYPHIHFEIYPSLSLATLYTNRILTSQLAMPSDVCATIYNNASGYSASVSNFASVSVSSDNVFGDNTSAQLAAMTPTLSGNVTDGYAGSIVIGIAV